ncbi:MAG: DUF5947 family protein [Vulcanimicrobiaceae bacterium]
MSLFRFARDPVTRTAPGERCELCAKPIDGVHSHLVDVKERRLICACRPCYYLFKPQGAAQGRYKAVPDRYVELTEFTMDQGQWDDLQIPIALAFFFFNSASNKMVAFYPGPAGATESMLSLRAWDQIVARYPRLGQLEPDVEAALIRRTREGTNDCFIVPIDACYELVGLIRASWKGFDGGEDAHRNIDHFFASLRSRSESHTAGTAR